MSFAFLGVAAGVWAKRFDDIARVSTFVILPLTYLGAVFIPITKYPEAIQPFARLNPLLYCIDGLRIGFLGRDDVSDVTLISSGVVIALSLAITISISLVALRRSTAIRN
jgi:ABC-2 type transport system permease protein